MEFTEQEISLYYETRSPGLKPSAGGWRGPCPVHQGKDPNFRVDSSTGMAFCHSQCGRGWDVIGLEQEIHACDFIEAKKSVYALLGRPAPSYEERDIEAAYDYRDEKGIVRYQVVRKTGKRFMQRRPRSGGGWDWGLGKTKAIPYHLPEMLSENFVIVAEGEKCVQAFEKLGYVATCNSGGAGNFKPELVPYFAGKDVAIFPDNDKPGRQHAIRVAEFLHLKAASVRIVEIPDLPEKGDVVDFVKAGGTAQQLAAFYGASQEWSPEWDFSSDVPAPGDEYILSIPADVTKAGGADAFWDYSLHEGVPTPFDRLTYALAGGMRKGEVYILGGNTGCGKTSLALQFASKALRAKVGVHVFSMEMSARDLFHRMLSAEARVDLMEFQDMQRHRLPVHADRAKLDEALRRYWQLALTVSCKPSITCEYLVEEVIRLTRRRPIGLVIIDHMQLMSSTAKGLRGDYEKFTNISRSLKAAAMEANVPILLLSQCASRENEKNNITELSRASLRGSGALEEDAAGVMLLYPDAEDLKRTIADGTCPKANVKSWLKLDKGRFGFGKLYIPLLHIKKYTRFDLITKEEAIA